MLPKINGFRCKREVTNSEYNRTEQPRLVAGSVDLPIIWGILLEVLKVNDMLQHTKHP